MDVNTATKKLGYMLIDCLELIDQVEPEMKSVELELQIKRRKFKIIFTETSDEKTGICPKCNRELDFNRNCKYCI